jgi:hypothetical protein
MRANPTEGREGLNTMTRTEPNRAARRRGELTGDRGSRRLAPAIDAQRRLNARRAEATQTDTDPFSPNDRRYAYLTRHDWEGLVKRLAKPGDGGTEEGTDERELYREIIRRAKTVRERAASTLPSR